MDINDILLNVKLSGEEKLFKDWIFDFKNMANTDKELNNLIIREFKDLKAYSLLKKKELSIGTVKKTNNSYDHIKFYIDIFDRQRIEGFDVIDLKNKVDELNRFKVLEFALFLDENKDKIKIISYNNFSFGNKLYYFNDDGKEYFKERTDKVKEFNQTELIIDFSGLYF